ncbi:septation protein SepH [Leucobacter sp. BZR 635]
MDELRVVRREEGSLILANELGEEYRLVVDEEIAQEVRLATPRTASSVRVRPREIQALLRSGKTRAEVASETGLDEADVERFEEPVRAEMRYMLDLAHAVSVRTDATQTSSTPTANADEQRFGQVISERLIGLGNTESSWRSWRDDEAGWLIGLTFDSREGEHDAVWTFDHKKRVLSPLTPDATNLSKLGEVGDRLIPKLRAVDNEQPERVDTPVFDPDGLLAPTAEIQPLTPADAVQQSEQGAHASQGAQSASQDAPPLNADAEYERRRDIDHLAVNTPDDGAADLSQTADLLDALRRRRGERSLEAELALDGEPGSDSEPAAGDSADQWAADRSPRALIDAGPRPQPGKRSGAAANIWGTLGVSATPDAARPDAAATERTDGTAAGAGRSGVRDSGTTAADSDAHDASGIPATLDIDVASGDAADGTGAAAADSETASTKRSGAKRDAKRSDSKRGRSSIPSWDDILFGTRSDDDPA